MKKSFQLLVVVLFLSVFAAPVFGQKLTPLTAKIEKEAALAYEQENKTMVQFTLTGLKGDVDAMKARIQSNDPVKLKVIALRKNNTYTCSLTFPDKVSKEYIKKYFKLLAIESYQIGNETYSLDDFIKLSK